MIQIDNIHIEYDKVIIENGSISVPAGQITAVTGDSGSGKTSILYMLGLLSANKGYTYSYFNKAIDTSDSHVTEKLRCADFGFLFQDNSLIDNLTVYENIRYFANLSGRKVNESDIADLLKSVDLDINAKRVYPKQLSGGEQQRAAIAAILAKNPKCIFADEPTSALDQTNTEKIAKILRSLAESGMTVVIATHSPFLSEFADKVYCIKEKKLLLVKEAKKVDAVPKNERKKADYRYGVKDMFRYARNGSRRSRVLKTIIAVVCSMAITGFSLVNSVMDFLNLANEDMINQLSDREIFVVNKAANNLNSAWVRYDDCGLCFEKDEYDVLEKTKGVANVYPFYGFTSYANLGDVSRSTTVHVNTDGNTADYIYINGDQNFIVIPYNEYQPVEQQTTIRFLRGNKEKDGSVYLSYQMAESLGLIGQDHESVTLSFSIAVPVKCVRGQAFVRKPGSEPIYVDDDEIISEWYEMEVNVAGILQPDYAEMYSTFGNMNILMPQDRMDGILREMQEKYSDNEYEEWVDSESGFEVHEWRPSACLVYADSYRDIDDVVSRITKLLPHIDMRSNYQDMKELESQMAEIRDVSNMIIYIVLGVIFVLMSTLFISITVSRKREIALLKAYGMSKKNLIALLSVESLMQGLGITVISLIVAAVLSALGSMLLVAQIRILSVMTVVYAVGATIAFILLPTIISVIYSIKVAPEKILRN